MGKGVGMGGGEIEISHVGGGMGFIWWYGIGCMGLLWRDVNSLLSTTVVILGPSLILIERVEGGSWGHGWWGLDWIIIVIGLGVRRVCVDVGGGLVWWWFLIWLVNWVIEVGSFTSVNLCLLDQFNIQECCWAKEFGLELCFHPFLLA